jgi:DNA mismatch repair protein MutL
MSNYIKILPERVINKIAAGEVIQRPESVVKELVENSIDAGATRITLIIKDSGKTLIQIMDNGKGMSPEDADICFIRHSTSKINDEKDLESIHTLGFRGEALYSVSAIAQVEVKTRTENDELGTVLYVENSKVTNTSKDSCEVGTSISVKNLFYNVPARRNFLKSDATETKHIFETFTKFCISYPEIEFKLINDENTVYNYHSGDLRERIQAVFKSQDIENFIFFNEDLDFLKVKGFIGKPQFLKKNRGDQYLFLNQRQIQSKSINHAVVSAYQNFAKIEGYPFFILFLHIDPSKIDVNVHPSKLEVKFYDERSIYAIVNSVIKKALGSSDLVPDYNFSRGTRDSIKLNSENRVADFRTSERSDNDSSFSFPRSSGIFNYNKQEKFNIQEYSALFTSPKGDDIFKGNEVKDENREIIETPLQEYEHKEDIILNKGIWQLNLKYIVTRVKTGIIIIDQHVAHERILYEKALVSLNNKLPFSQQLLFPKTLELSPVDFQLVKDLLEDLSNLGFIIKIFSKNSIVIEGVPSVVKFNNEENFLREILIDFQSNKELGIDSKDKLAASFACKAAIKFGDFLTEDEMIVLVDQLFATSMPFVCPHGRPVIIKVTIDELDKRFGRK